MITQNVFDKQVFLTHGFIDPWPEETFYRVPPGFKPIQQDPCELQGKLLTILHEAKARTGVSIFDLVNIHCMIPYSTYKKMLRGRRASRKQIAQLAVGLKLSVAEANELFLLQGGTLNLSNDADFITYYALESKDAIEDYLDELDRYLGSND